MGTVAAALQHCYRDRETVGKMVKAWREEQAAQVAPLPDMPESVTQAMHKAVADLWGTAAAIAAERVESVQNDAKEAIDKARGELAEYMGEVARLENENSGLADKVTETEKRLSDSAGEVSRLTTENAALSARLDDRGAELERLRGDFDKLQTELLAIAKGKDKTK